MATHASRRTDKTGKEFEYFCLHILETAGYDVEEQTNIGLRPTGGAHNTDLIVDGDTIISNVANAGGVIEANTPWCYGYGELEWMSPFQRENDAGNLVDATRENYLERAEQVTSFRVRCI